MNITEVKKLFERIKSYYSSFNYDDKKIKEWYNVLKKFDVKEINDSLNKYVEECEQPPIIFSLIRGLQKKEITQEDKIDYMKCEYCGEMIMVVNKNMDSFLEHERRCQKIDFIDRMSKQYRNKPINKNVYYSMSDDELEKSYRPIMNFYMQNSELKKTTDLFKVME